MEQSEEQLVCPSQYNTDGANFNIVFCSWADLKNAVLFSRVRSEKITSFRGPLSVSSVRIVSGILFRNKKFIALWRFSK